MRRKSDGRKLPKKITFGPAELANRSLLRRYRLGHAEAEAELVQRFLPMLYRMAIHCAKTDSDIDDFVQISYVFFRDCIRTFDFRRGTKFITHCYARIPLQLLRPRNEYSEIIRVPSCAKRGGVVTIPVASLDINYEDSHGEAHSSECLAFFESDPGDELDRREQIAKMQRLISSLPAQEQTIIRLRMNDVTLNVIGELMGISKERVRQIERYAQQMLRCWLTGEELSGFLKSRITRQADELPISAAG